MGTIGVRGRCGGRRTLAPLRSRAHALQDHKEHRHEGDGQQGRGHHPAEHYRTDRLLAGRARAECDHQRHHAQDEGLDVITMGRNRRRVASTAASSMDMPSWYRSRANSTMRMAFLLARAIIKTRPTWV